MNETLEKYYDMFGDYPPRVITMDYENEVYIKLMDEAIKNNKPISTFDLDEALDGIEYDLVYDEEKGEEDMDLNKIKKLLKTYGASDNEITNFVNDLQEKKEEVEEEEDINYLSKETMDKLKATDKGKDIIMNAPTMKREELKKLVKEYLSKE